MIAKGRLEGAGIEYSVNAPEVVTRPILLASNSVNHNAPSVGPTVMPKVLPGVGVGYSVKGPEVVILPIFEAISVNHNAPSGPEVIPTGALKSVGTGYSVSAPDVVNENAPVAESIVPPNSGLSGGKLLRSTVNHEPLCAHSERAVKSKMVVNHGPLASICARALEPEATTSTQAASKRLLRAALLAQLRIIIAFPPRSKKRAAKQRGNPWRWVPKMRTDLAPLIGHRW